jgi:hypothetical protein
VKGKPAKNAAPVAKTKAPRGMVVNILKHASRPKGVTPDELNTLTKWKGAPWKWLFSNPKKNGYCDRWYYKLTVLNPDKDTRGPSPTTSRPSNHTATCPHRGRGLGPGHVPGLFV